MAYITNKDYLIEVAKGNIAGASIIHKFGANFSLASSFEPISVGGLYNMPQSGSPVTLRVKAGNVNDTAGGTGAREITIQGLDANGSLQTESVATAGTSASSNFSGTWIRVFRAWVSESGTYSTTSGGSHAADIVIESDAAAEWLTIYSTGFARGQSQVGCYSVPLGFTAYVLDYYVTVNTGKTVDFTFFKRENILETAAPYTACRLQFESTGITTPFKRTFTEPLKYEELTDIGCMAKGAQAPSVTVDFHILLIEN